MFRGCCNKTWIGTVLLAVVLSGCAAGSTLDEVKPAVQPEAAAEWAMAAKHGEVPPGKSRVYIFLGSWHFPDSQFSMPVVNRTTADIYLNFINVGGINPGECLVLDLPAGVYNFSWLERSRYPFKTVPMRETLAAGNARFLSLETDQHSFDAPSDTIVGYFDDEMRELSTIDPLSIVIPDEPAVDEAISREERP